MKANDENMLDYMFMNRRQYHIPVYQRNYDWKKKIVYCFIMTSFKQLKMIKNISLVL